jgi:uncharacterized caspase-like protein
VGSRHGACSNPARALRSISFASRALPALRSLRPALAALALAAGSSAAQAPAAADPAGSAERRVAVVIGNAAYAGAPLRNPLNDARAMAEQLRALGFEVVEARDASRAQMRRAIERARDTLRGRRGVGLLYYAGHGMQLDWRNYMLPVDAQPRDAAELAALAVDVQEVMDAFRDAGTQINIVVLDACRDNPFGASAGGSKGLAPMDAPPGTLLAYATAPGNVADDGDAASANGLYTRYLVQELGKPAVGIETVFKRVRHQVRRDSEGRQIPWESTSLEDEFYFAAATTVPTGGSASAAAPGAQDRERQERQEREEREARDEAEAWQRAHASGNARDIGDFLVRFPNGALAEQAQFRLDQLQRRKIQAQQRREQAGSTGVAPGDWRYRVGDVLEYEVSGLAARVGRPLPGSERLPRGARPDRPERPERPALADAPAPGTGGMARIRLEVTAADADKVEFNQGRVVTDQMGTSLVEAGLRKTPGHVKVPTELHVGKRWETAFDAHDLLTGTLRARPRWSYRVAALETLEVKAGRFKAWRIEGAGSDALVTPGRPRPRDKAMRHQLWVDAATLVVLKEELQMQLGGVQRRDETRELLALKQAPRR